MTATDLPVILEIGVLLVRGLIEMKNRNSAVSSMANDSDAGIGTQGNA